MKPSFVASRPNDDLLQSVATSEMTNHRIIDPAGPEVAEYANGRAIYVNLTDHDITAEGRTVPALSHLAA